MPVNSVDAAGKTTQYGFDARNRLLSVTDARNNTTQMAYDDITDGSKEPPINWEITRCLAITTTDKLKPLPQEGIRTSHILMITQIACPAYRLPLSTEAFPTMQTIC
jgi:YD repeat-containing protein